MALNDIVVTFFCKKDTQMMDSAVGLQFSADQPRMCKYVAHSASMKEATQYLIMEGRSPGAIAGVKPTLVKLAKHHLDRTNSHGGDLQMSFVSQAEYVSQAGGQAIFEEIETAKAFFELAFPKSWSALRGAARYFNEDRPSRKYFKMVVTSSLADCGEDEDTHCSAKNYRRAAYSVVVCPLDYRYDAEGCAVPHDSVRRDVKWEQMVCPSKAECTRLHDKRASMCLYPWDRLHACPLRVVNSSALRKRARKSGIPGNIVYRTKKASKTVQSSAIKNSAMEEYLIKAKSAYPDFPQHPEPCCEDMADAHELIVGSIAAKTDLRSDAMAELLEKQEAHPDQLNRSAQFLGDVAVHTIAQLASGLFAEDDICVQFDVKHGARVCGVDNLHADEYSRLRFDFEHPFFNIFWDKNTPVNARVFVNGVPQMADKSNLRPCVVQFKRDGKSRASKLDLSDMCKYNLLCEFAPSEDGYSMDPLTALSDLEVETSIVAFALLRDGQLVKSVRFQVSFEDGGILVDPRQEVDETVSPLHLFFFRLWMPRTYQLRRKLYCKVVEWRYPAAAAAHEFGQELHKRKSRVEAGASASAPAPAGGQEGSSINSADVEMEDVDIVTCSDVAAESNPTPLPMGVFELPTKRTRRGDILFPMDFPDINYAADAFDDTDGFSADLYPPPPSADTADDASPFDDVAVGQEDLATLDLLDVPFTDYMFDVMAPAFGDSPLVQRALHTGWVTKRVVKFAARQGNKEALMMHRRAFFRAMDSSAKILLAKSGLAE